MQMWRKHKNNTTPKPDQRRRPTARPDQARHVYTSYYAGRENTTPSQNATRGVRTRDQMVVGNKKITVGNGMRSFGGQKLIGVLCSVIVAFCALRLLYLVPVSKIIVPSTTAGQVAVDEYAKKANMLLGESALNRTKITLNANGIAAALSKTFPELEDVVVTVPIIGTHPLVYISPARPVIMLETGGGLYTVNQRGYVLAKLGEPVANLPKLLEGKTRYPKPGVQYLAGSTVDFVRTVTYQMQKANFTVQDLQLPASAPYELQVRVQGRPFVVRFNLQEDPLQQSGGAVAALQQLGADYPKEYLDVRAGGRAFYK